ncbi:hypothetical protein CONCODRAFT_12661 [Conidiobolus coronatus NRRL 28638]|uniref:Xylanolytic transcriptional activator regulatory domain-containing protein n=1 Tax=Conidiobolus coronatus (strain ATCC 28846 / CBS 209.66 / NRRL 28638) TaxID=796925 RepID=A0A137NSH0_CONC2|nr:hypothetical protein CONCODRAFT_12661 [Conidiobolus coronatus NRRL 28638]|eukprot:KXN65684.1 hypothetical protein CONCODRAFT_12661 [Conidiobolus coronatus NRRL 28638]
MDYKSNNIEYKPCIKCKITLLRSDEDYCSNCKYRQLSTKPIATVKYRIFMAKFNSKNNNNIKSYLNKHSDSAPGKVININNTKIQRNLRLTDNADTQKAADFSFCLEFNNIDDLSSFILKSKQINLVYLSLIGAKKLQSVPKIQKLIENHEELSSYKVYYPKSHTPPYTSPLKLLTKSSFWESLLNVYFKSFYDSIPIFSIAQFNPKTAPESLLAAIYYTGYKSQPDQPKELTLYMDNYAKANLKLLIRECSLSAIQALLLYFSVYYYEGNAPLHYHCRAHATRIGYALGIHLDNKIFSELEKYTRRLGS